MARFALILVLLALLPVAARAELKPELIPPGLLGSGYPALALPVVDLRVGLSRSMLLDPSLAKGVGQGGYVELGEGRVVGVLLPVSDRYARPTRTDTAADYFALRAALKASERFAVSDCRGRTGRVSVWFELEAPDELAREPSSVALWVQRGVRVFAIASERDNALATAATGFAPGPITGLTGAGRAIVARIHESRAMVDVSGASDLTIEEVTAMAKQSGLPVIATHSNARALADQPRNLSDTTMRQIAATGGLIALTAAHGSLAPGRSASVRDLVRQILHVIRVVGSEHVALGTGFEAGVTPLRGFRSASDFPRLAAALQARGLGAADLRRVFFENALRVLCPSPSADQARPVEP